MLEMPPLASPSSGGGQDQGTQRQRACGICSSDPEAVLLGSGPDPPHVSSDLAGGILAPPSGCFGPGLPFRAGGEPPEGQDSLLQTSSTPPEKRNPSVILRLHRVHPPGGWGAVSF